MIIKKYKLFIKESSQEEVDRLLDKISKFGIESLTKSEKDVLDSFNPSHSDKSDDVVTFDKDNNILINGKSYNQYVSGSCPEEKIKPNDKKTPNYGKTLNDKLSRIFKADKSRLYKLFEDDFKFVSLDLIMPRKERTYYILFKKLKVDDDIRTLKLVYNLNIRSDNNFKIYDNYENEIPFNQIDVKLQKHGLNFGDFNDAWYYIEDNFLNQGYTNGDE